MPNTGANSLFNTCSNTCSEHTLNTNERTKRTNGDSLTYRGHIALRNAREKGDIR